MKTRIKGSVTEVKVVEIDITVHELVKSAIPHMKVDDVIKVLKGLLEKKFRENDPSLPKNAEIDWYRKKWEVFAFVDYHKNDDVYNTVRAFNDEELQYMLAIDSIFAVLNH